MVNWTVKNGHIKEAERLLEANAKCSLKDKDSINKYSPESPTVELIKIWGLWSRACICQWFNKDGFIPAVFTTEYWIYLNT